MAKMIQISGVWDGNIFAVMGMTGKHLKQAGKTEQEVHDFYSDVQKSKSYDEALNKCITALENAGYKVS